MSRAIVMPKPVRALNERLVAVAAAVVVAFPLGFGVARWTSNDHASPVHITPSAPLSVPTPITGDAPCHIGRAC